jgi:outer membrane lipoprotein-sorting protein
MTFEDVRTIGDRRIPCRMKLVPADAPGEFTEVVYESIEFNVPIPESTFTLQALK